jgi:alkaline phosphatase D
MAVSRTAYDLSVLDTRQYRSDQACGFGAAKDCAAASRTDRSMLGAEQEAWLFARLPQVRATWTILGQQVPLFARDSGPQATGPRFSMDKWDGYTAGRQRLFTRLLETRSPNPIVLSGDVHVHYGADLRVDFADEKSPAIGTEFTNTAVTSGGDGTDVRQLGDSAALQPAHQVPQQSAGYIACTATNREMRADFMVVDAVTKPDAPARRAGALVVETGRKGAMTD